MGARQFSTSCGRPPHSPNFNPKEHPGHRVFGQIALQVLQEAQQCPAPDLGGDPPEHQLSSHGAWPPDVVVRPRKLLSISFQVAFIQLVANRSLGAAFVMESNICMRGGHAIAVLNSRCVEDPLTDGAVVQWEMLFLTVYSLVAVLLAHHHLAPS